MKFFSALFLALTIIGFNSAHAESPAGFADLAKRLSPAVVNISTSQTVRANRNQGQPPFDQFLEEFFGKRIPQQRSPRNRKVSSLGSGFIISADGVIITNNHVIENADEIMVKLSDGRSFPAKLVGRDPKTDIAVLKLTAKKPFPFVPLGDSNKARVGDWVIAIGNPFGLGGSLSAGVISAINRNINAGPYDSFIQTDAAINRGNSGGPLFNLKGEVIGVNSAIISPSGGSVGIGFAIPADIVKDVTAQLQKYGETRRGWLGVRIQPVTKDLAANLGLGEAMGALVSEVSPAGPAAKAGIRRGDVITKFDGQRIEEMRDLPRSVASTQIDKRVAVEVICSGKKRTLQVVTGRLQEDVPSIANDNGAPKDGTQILGLSVEELTDPIRRELGVDNNVQGVVVEYVDPESAAGDSGLARGDIIMEIDNQPVTKTGDVNRILTTAINAKKQSVLVLLQSRQGTRYIALRLDKK